VPWCLRYGVFTLYTWLSKLDARMSRQYGFQSGKSLLPICLDMHVLKRIMKMSHYVP
jgi:hypothetical protein